MNDVDIPNLDELIHDIVVNLNPTGGADNPQIYAGVVAVIGPTLTSTDVIDRTVNWLRMEGCLRAEGQKWYGIEFEKQLPWPTANEGEEA